MLIKLPPAAPSGLEGIVEVMGVVLQLEAHPRLCDHPVQDLACIVTCCPKVNARLHSVCVVPLNHARGYVQPHEGQDQHVVVGCCVVQLQGDSPRQVPVFVEHCVEDDSNTLTRVVCTCDNTAR